MFIVFIVARSMHQQVTKCLKIRKIQYYYCLENIHIVTNTALNKGYIMGCSILRQSLGLYNHFDTHEAEYHDTIFNHCSDMYIAISMCVCVHVCVNMFSVNIQIIPINPYFPLQLVALYAMFLRACACVHTANC